jgi:hypothetical protein
MIENIPRQPLPAGPGEGPEGWRQADLFQLLFRLQLEIMRLVCQIKPHLRHMRRRHDASVFEDKLARVRLH